MRRLALLSIALCAIGCSGTGESVTTSPPPTDGESTTSTIETADTSPPTTVSPDTTEGVDEWDAFASWRGGAAGEYRTVSFAVPFRFTTSSAWTGSDQTDNVSMTKAGESGIWILDMGFDTIEDGVAHFQSMENAEFVEPTSTTVGGAPAVTMSGLVTANQSIARLADGLSLMWSAGTESTLYIVEVGGDVVAITIDEAPPIPPNFAAETQSILDSIIWRALEERP